MTDKEALKIIRDELKYIIDDLDTYDRAVDNAYKQIKKDLEVLEILKNKNIDLLAIKKFNEVEAYNSYVYTYNEKAKLRTNEILKNIDYLDSNNFGKIKEWLENDKKK